MNAHLRSIVAKTIAPRLFTALVLSALVLLGGIWSAVNAQITTRALNALTTVNFDAPPPGGTFNGVFEGIDFGTGQWQWSGPYYVNSTNHIYFSDSAGTSRTFQFSPVPRVLHGLCVYALREGTLTLSDDAGQTFTREVPLGTLQLLYTGWTRASTTVTVSFTEGWSLGVDEITYAAAP